MMLLIGPHGLPTVFSIVVVDRPVTKYALKHLAVRRIVLSDQDRGAVSFVATLLGGRSEFRWRSLGGAHIVER